MKKRVLKRRFVLVGFLMAGCSGVAGSRGNKVERADMNDGILSDFQKYAIGELKFGDAGESDATATANIADMEFLKEDPQEFMKRECGSNPVLRGDFKVAGELEADLSQFKIGKDLFSKMPTAEQDSFYRLFTPDLRTLNLAVQTEIGFCIPNSKVDSGAVVPDGSYKLTGYVTTEHGQRLKLTNAIAEFQSSIPQAIKAAYGATFIAPQDLPPGFRDVKMVISEKDQLPVFNPGKYGYRTKLKIDPNNKVSIADYTRTLTGYSSSSKENNAPDENLAIGFFNKGGELTGKNLSLSGTFNFNNTQTKVGETLPTKPTEVDLLSSVNRAESPESKPTITSAGVGESKEDFGYYNNDGITGPLYNAGNTVPKDSKNNGQQTTDVNKSKAPTANNPRSPLSSKEKLLQDLPVPEITNPELFTAFFSSPEELAKASLPKDPPLPYYTEPKTFQWMRKKKFEHYVANPKSYVNTFSISGVKGLCRKNLGNDYKWFSVTLPGVVEMPPAYKQDKNYKNEVDQQVRETPLHNYRLPVIGGLDDWFISQLEDLGPNVTWLLFGAFNEKNYGLFFNPMKADPTDDDDHEVRQYDITFEHPPQTNWYPMAAKYSKVAREENQFLIYPVLFVRILPPEELAFDFRSEMAGMIADHTDNPIRNELRLQIKLKIEDGLHPVIERIDSSDQFVAQISFLGQMDKIKPVFRLDTTFPYSPLNQASPSSPIQPTQLASTPKNGAARN